MTEWPVDLPAWFWRAMVELGAQARLGQGSGGRLMTEQELAAIEAHLSEATEDDDAWLTVVCRDGAALVAEVRRLRAEIDRLRRHLKEQPSV